jgi:hypothetical protein
VCFTSLVYVGTDTKLTSSKTWTVNTLGGLTMNFSKVRQFMIADVGFFPHPQNQQMYVWLPLFLLWFLTLPFSFYFFLFWGGVSI